MEFKNKKGFILEFTTVYTHQQNRKVEYSIYTILDTVQSMPFDSELPMKYWLETVWTVVYPRNLILSKWNSGIMLAEVWYGIK